jgi:hypoxanthine phosphoribosyltransferase
MPNQASLHEEAMKVLLSAEQIHERIVELARQITADYAGQPVTLLGVLNGSLMFLADLVRQLELPTRISFLQASSYRGETTVPGQLTIHPGSVPDLRDRHVLILDDILDSGQTLAEVIKRVENLQPKSLRVAVLLRKRARQKIPLEPDYCGFEIPDVFVIGYGLDYNDEYRGLPYVGVLESGGGSA